MSELADSRDLSLVEKSGISPNLYRELQRLSGSLGASPRKMLRVESPSIDPNQLWIESPTDHASLLTTVKEEKGEDRSDAAIKSEQPSQIENSKQECETELAPSSGHGSAEESKKGRKRPQRKAVKDKPVRRSTRTQKIKTQSVAVPIQAATSGWISTKSSHSFHDSILTKIDITNYYQSVRDERDSQELISAVSHCKASQLDRFIHESKTYFVMSWLSCARIFQYVNGHYVECKRIPTRYIELSPRVITSLHYKSSKLYIAYLWGNEEAVISDIRRPYLEIRDLHGKLLNPITYFDKPIRRIYSDKNFMYLLVGSSSINVHRHGFFKSLYHSIDYSSFSSQVIIGAYINCFDDKPLNSFKLVSVTQDQLLVSSYDAFCHCLLQCFNFNDGFNIIGLLRYKKIYIIHRILKERTWLNLSRIEIGSLRNCDRSGPYFHYEFSLRFEQPIYLVKRSAKYLYLLGCDEKSDQGLKYQIACIHLPTLSKLWITFPNGLDQNSNMTISEDHIIVTMTDQKFITIDLPTTKSPLIECEECNLRFITPQDKDIHLQSSHLSIFSGLEVWRNSSIYPDKVDVLKSATFAKWLSE